MRLRGAVADRCCPHGLSFSQQEILVFLTINVLLVTSYRLLTLTGEWSLAHVVIMGVGAYASALLTKHLGVYVPLSMLLGGLVAALVACVLSFPLFRMKGFYFLIGSFAAGEIIRLLWKHFREPFGGAEGAEAIDPMPDFSTRHLRFRLLRAGQLLLFRALIVVVCLWCCGGSSAAPVGLTFHAVHWQDKLAEAVGRRPARLPHAGLRRWPAGFAGLARRAAGALHRHDQSGQLRCGADGLRADLGHRRRHRAPSTGRSWAGRADHPQRDRAARARASSRCAR